jgi:hypothetical protein
VAWQAHRGTLARHMTFADWDHVMDAFLDLEVVERISKRVWMTVTGQRRSSRIRARMGGTGSCRTWRLREVPFAHGGEAR